MKKGRIVLFLDPISPPASLSIAVLVSEKEGKLLVEGTRCRGDHSTMQDSTLLAES